MKTIDLRPYHQRNRYTLYRKFLAWIGATVFYSVLLAALLTGIMYG